MAEAPRQTLGKRRQKAKTEDDMKTITEKELQSAAEAPGNGWFIIEAAGDHPHTYPDDDGKELEFVLHVPSEALEAVAAAGVPGEGLLVDKAT